MENKDRELKTAEAKEVSGGQSGERNARNCPVCGALCYAFINTVKEGEGCDSNTYWLCPKCGHKWL